MSIHIPFVGENFANSSPVYDKRDWKDFAEYLSFEAGAKVAQKRVKFTRTAKIQKTKYWLYRVSPLNDDEFWGFVYSIRVFFILPTYCSSCYFDGKLSAEEVLLKHHWQRVAKLPDNEYSLDLAVERFLNS